MVTWIRYASVALAAAALGWAVGRHTAPERVTETRVENTEAIAQAVSQARRKWMRDVKTTTKTVYVEGKPVERIVYRDSHAGGAEEGSSLGVWAGASAAATSKTVEPRRAGWAIQAAVDPLDPRRVGAEAQIRVFGPIWLGAGMQRTDKIRPAVSARVEF